MMLPKEIKVTKPVKEFSRFAHQYSRYNIIQAEVARALVDSIPVLKYDTILDIGCGSGEVYKNIQKRHISFDKFVALDFSREMLLLHPCDTGIQKYRLDFDTLQSSLFSIQKENSLIVSSSALQWSKNLDYLLKQLSAYPAKAYFAIFTSNTFKTLHKTAAVKSPIYSADFLKNTIDRHYHAYYNLKQYQLEFETTKDIFGYIKKSGISGGEKQLDYRRAKRLMYEYPLDYLEFEVLFVEAAPLN